MVWLPSCVAPAAALSRANPLLLFAASDVLVLVDVLSVVGAALVDVGELLLAELESDVLLELLLVVEEPVIAGVDAEAEAPIPLVRAEPLMEAEGPDAPVH